MLFSDDFTKSLLAAHPSDDNVGEPAEEEDAEELGSLGVPHQSE